MQIPGPSTADTWNAYTQVMSAELANFERVHALDVFAGEGHLADALVDAGMHTLTYEIQDDKAQDVLTEEVQGKTTALPTQNPASMLARVSQTYPAPESLVESSALLH